MKDDKLKWKIILGAFLVALLALITYFLMNWGSFGLLMLTNILFVVLVFAVSAYLLEFATKAIRGDYKNQKQDKNMTSKRKEPNLTWKQKIKIIVKTSKMSIVAPLLTYLILAAIPLRFVGGLLYALIFLLACTYAGFKAMRSGQLRLLEATSAGLIVGVAVGIIDFFAYLTNSLTSWNVSVLDALFGFVASAGFGILFGGIGTVIGTIVPKPHK